MPISFMGYSQEDLVKMVWLYERIEHAKNRDRFNLDTAIEKNYIRIKLPNNYIVTSGEKKMTREEAVKKVRGSACASQVLADQILDAVEALGLIKFEEEKPEVKFVNITHHHLIGTSTSVIAVDVVIEALRRIDIICVRKES